MQSTKQRGNSSKIDMKKKTKSRVLSCATFFLFLNAFVGFCWAFVIARGGKAETLIFISIIALQLIVSFFTFLNIKYARNWFICTTTLVSVLTIFFILNSLYEVKKIMTNSLPLNLILLVGIFGVIFLSRRAYKGIWKDTLPANIASGKIDIENGVYSIVDSSATYNFKSKIFRQLSASLVAGSSILIAMASVMGMRMGQMKRILGDVYGAFLCYCVALILSIVVPWLFYQYEWIKEWEDNHKKDMLIKYI